MDGYERIINMMKNQDNSSNNIFLTTMNGPTSCYVNNLPLEADDLLIADHLKTGWYKDANTYIEPLKQGDTVIGVKLNETKYCILERVV